MGSVSGASVGAESGAGSDSSALCSQGLDLLLQRGHNFLVLAWSRCRCGSGGRVGVFEHVFERVDASLGDARGYEKKREPSRKINSSETETLDLNSQFVSNTVWPDRRYGLDAPLHLASELAGRWYWVPFMLGVVTKRVTNVRPLIALVVYVRNRRDGRVATFRPIPQSVSGVGVRFSIGDRIRDLGEKSFCLTRHERKFFILLRCCNHFSFFILTEQGVGLIFGNVVAFLWGGAWGGFGGRAWHSGGGGQKVE
jgi:hypothetical protein